MDKPESLLTKNLFTITYQIDAIRMEENNIQFMADAVGRNSDIFKSLGYDQRQKDLNLNRQALLDEAQHWIVMAREELITKPSRFQRLLSVFQ